MLKWKENQTISLSRRDPAHFETVKAPEQKMEKPLINNWANFKQTSLDSSVDVQKNLVIYIALDKSLCAKTTAFK